MARLPLADIVARCIYIDHAHAYTDCERVRLYCSPHENWQREEALLLEQGFVLCEGETPVIGGVLKLYERSCLR